MKTLDIIQGFCDHVFRDKKGNRIFPNIFVGKWEADLLEVTRSRLTYEYEVKVSRCDFHKDKKKSDKYGKNPLKLLGRMMPAYFTALGTQSSAATIPVTLEQSRKNGVSADIAGFVIPLCATIHLSGSTLKIVACALALMIMQGMPHDFPLFAGFIFMLGITMVAAPGVPGGAIMASLGILQSMLGFDESAQALMIALYIAMDSFGTACNVTGDGAIALIIDKVMGKK